MALGFVSRIFMFVALCLTQVLVFNHVHLFHCATPFIYIYMVLLFPHNYPRWAALLWSFAMGLTVDTFSNTPGVAAASLTLVGVIQPYFYSLFVQRDAPEDISPSISTMGFAKFTFFVFVLVLVYCTAFFSLEAFSFFNWLLWLECIGGSTLLTVILIVAIESVRKK